MAHSIQISFFLGRHAWRLGLVIQIRPALRYALVVGAPLMILVGGAIGALAAAALSANPIMQVRKQGDVYEHHTPRPPLNIYMQLIVVLPSVVQVGLIAFGVAALLYLVTEELLVEVRENPFVCLFFCLCLCVGFLF